MANKKVLEIVVKDKATPAVKKVDKALKNTSKQAINTSKTATKSVNGLNDSLTAMPGPISKIITGFKMLKVALLSSGIGAILVAAGALAGLFAAATKKGAEFAKQISTLKAVSGATSEELGQLSKSAKELGSSTQFTAVEVAGLQTEYAKLGKTVPEILAATAATLDLAASLEVGLAEAATLAGSVVNSFGLQAKDTQRVVDVLAKSTASSSLDFGLLTESLKMAAPIARATGMTIEQTAASLGVLADNGIKGSLAGTGLSKVMSELNKQGLTFKEAYDKVNAATDKLGTAQKLVGDVGAKSLLNLANGEEAIDKLTEALKNSGGAAKAMAEIRLDNLEGDTTKLGSAWEGFLLSLEDGSGIFTELARMFTQRITTIINGITELNIKFGALSAEFEASTGVFKLMGLRSDAFFNNFKIGLLKVKKILASVPLIGTGIDKKQVEESIQNIREANAKIANEAHEILKAAEERRQEGTFMERYHNRLKEGETKKLLEAEQKLQEKAAAKQAELDEEALARRKKAYQKYLAFRNKLEKRQENFEDKTEEEKLARQKERDLKELSALKVSKKNKTAARLLIDKFYSDKFLELEQKRLAKEKILNDKADIKKQAAINKAQKLKDKADADEIKKQDKQWNMLQKLQNTAQEQELLELAQQYDAKILLAEGNAELILALNEQQKIDEIAIEEKYNAEQVAITKKSQQQKADAFEQGAMMTMNALIAINDLTQAFAKEDEASQKKAFKINKAISIANATISTAVGISKAIASSAPPMNFVNAAIVAATGIAAVKNIEKTTFDSSSFDTLSPSTSGGAGGGNGGGTSPSQAPNFNVVGQSGFNQLASALGTSQPVQAFVVAGNVTTAQQLANNTIQQATF